jgi:lysophospholipase L1-like esterase
VPIQDDDTLASKHIHRPISIKVISIMVIILASIVIFCSTPLLHSFANGITPARPAGFIATPGDQSAQLNWKAASDATTYEIQTTDLATDVVSISPPQTTNTFTAESLAVGHWYRFRVIPLNGSTAGPASSYIDVRTKGFSGTYASYFALGDSYSSGEGIPPYTDVPCARSNSSFAYQIGNGVPSPVMIACAGASTDDIDKTAQGPGGTQLWELQSGTNRTNTLNTISVGGNDIGFTSEIKKCILADCTPDQSALRQKIAALTTRLVQVYEEIHTAAPDADIFVIGYPLLVAAPDQASCHNSTTKSGLTTNEMTMIRTLGNQFHSVMQDAAQFDGVSFVNGASTFQGHEACSKDQSAEWINEVTTSDINGSFHPNQLGSAAYAKAVNEARNDLYASGQVHLEATNRQLFFKSSHPE